MNYPPHKFPKNLYYAAGSWKKRKRRVVIKAEHTVQGANPRFIVTSLGGEPEELYDKIYCARGEMENRIKEQQLDLLVLSLSKYLLTVPVVLSGGPTSSV